MAYNLMSSDIDWLRQIDAAFESQQALGGVPMGASARLTGFELVDWTGSSGLSITAKGRKLLLDELATTSVERRSATMGDPGCIERRGIDLGPAIISIGKQPSTCFERPMNHQWVRQ
jgi:hypothetical protein